MKKDRVRDLVERTRKKSLISAVVEEEKKVQEPKPSKSAVSSTSSETEKPSSAVKRHVHIMMSEGVYTRAVIYQAKTRKFSRLSHLIEAALVEYLDRHEQP